MERLTKKHYKDEDGYYISCSENCDRGDCNSCLRFSNIVDTLGRIEDILGDEYDTDRLAELVRAEKEGRCVVLPVKAGDTVYSAFPLCGVNSHQIRKIEINADGGFACSALMIPFSDFGKTVFLTREEAEKALKEGENNAENNR